MADADVDNMSLKELKEVIAKAGLTLDGCIEKSDIRQRAREAFSMVSLAASRREVLAADQQVANELIDSIKELAAKPAAPPKASGHGTRVSPERQVSPERLAAAMRAERALAAGKATLFARPEFPDKAACRFLEAAECGNWQRVQQCLAKGTPAATADLNGHTALHKCAFMGFEAIAKLLIDSDPGCVDARDLCAMAGLEPHTSDPRRICHSSVRALPRTGCATCRCTRPPSATT